MLYITGIHALNLPCSLMTCGDWHCSSIQWKRPNMRESKQSIFGDYGIEFNVTIPEHDGTYAVANHIRALLDLLELGIFSVAQGMNNDFICNDDYNDEIFGKVTLLSDSLKWNEIDRFMGKEYAHKWLDYKKTAGLSDLSDAFVDKSLIDFPCIFTKKQLKYIMRSVIDAAQIVFTEKLRDVILFGSYARGDYKEWSDVDIMILVDVDDLDSLEIWQLEQTFTDLLADLSFHMNLLLNTIITPYGRFERMKEVYPFYRNVNVEGKRLCPAMFLYKPG